MRIGSLFSGIGGLELGLERAIPGSKVLWQVEKDSYARMVLSKHWPDAKRFEDVREVGRHNLQTVDVVCGGFPCQDISRTGSGEGLHGERSGLWFEFARIIREIRPRYAVLENVSMLRSRGLGVVLQNLASLGYDAIWDCIPASFINAPHQRDRLFVVAYANNVSGKTMRRECAYAQKASTRRQSLSGRRCGNAGRQRSVQRPRELPSPFKTEMRQSDAWEDEPGLDRVVDGIPNRVDRYRCLGNAVVPQVSEILGRIIYGMEVK